MLTNRSENSIVILTEANLAEIAWKPKLFSWLSATYPQSGIYKFWTARISFAIHESLLIAWKKRDKNQRKDFHFQLFIQNQKSFFSLDGRIAFGWSIARPSISHRNSWRVNNLASEALRGHWTRIDYADCRCVCNSLIAGLFCYFAFRRNRKINCYNFMLFLTGRYGILWDFASHVSKSPDMIIKTAALNVIPLTPGLISKTTCAAFLNQFHPFLVRTFGMPLNHSCPTPLLCTMSILDKQHFTLNQTCPMS